VIDRKYLTILNCLMCRMLKIDLNYQLRLRNRTSLMNQKYQLFQMNRKTR
jgi:hypothetical protein